MQSPSFNTIILTGRPGSGKGTQAKRLAEALGWVHFSTGERFKELRDGEGPIAAHVREAYDAGELLPDWFANYIFEDVALSLRPEQGIVCDGYPRTLAQAERFASVMDWLERPYRVLDLAVSNEEVTARMLKRAEEEHRPDSATPERIATRLHVYDSYTAPLLGYFNERGLLTELDGSKTPDEVAEAIHAALAT
ncbi:MAG TPA: nucleoside monophosphate kinase [Candidatus Paceibacterota bacterium]|nr:nucleoside monophosphate kinase [Candidatus Paceibacterota bacterium]